MHARRVTCPQRRGDTAHASEVVIGAGAAVAGSRSPSPGPFSAARPSSSAAVGVVFTRVPDRAVSALAGRGALVRWEMERLARELVGRGGAPVVDAAVAAMNLTQLVARHVDIDLLAAQLDVDAVVARGSTLRRS